MTSSITAGSSGRDVHVGLGLEFASGRGSGIGADRAGSEADVKGRLEL